MKYNELAFFTGLFGSIHCVGMCGPLAFAIPSFREQAWLILFDKLLYNIGRTLTYTVLGLFIGLVGQQLWLAGVQKSLSILTPPLDLVPDPYEETAIQSISICRCSDLAKSAIVITAPLSTPIKSKSLPS
jgi:hypothetical protein